MSFEDQILFGPGFSYLTSLSISHSYFLLTMRLCNQIHPSQYSIIYFALEHLKCFILKAFCFNSHIWFNLNFACVHIFFSRKQKHNHEFHRSVTKFIRTACICSANFISCLIFIIIKYKYVYYCYESIAWSEILSVWAEEMAYCKYGCCFHTASCSLAPIIPAAGNLKPTYVAHLTQTQKQKVVRALKMLNMKVKMPTDSRTFTRTT